MQPAYRVRLFIFALMVINAQAFSLTIQAPELKPNSDGTFLTEIIINNLTTQEEQEFSAKLGSSDDFKNIGLKYPSELQYNTIPLNEGGAKLQISGVTSTSKILLDLNWKEGRILKVITLLPPSFVEEKLSFTMSNTKDTQINLNQASTKQQSNYNSLSTPIAISVDNVADDDLFNNSCNAPSQDDGIAVKTATAQKLLLSNTPDVNSNLILSIHEIKESVAKDTSPNTHLEQKMNEMDNDEYIHPYQYILMIIFIFYFLLFMNRNDSKKFSQNKLHTVDLKKNQSYIRGLSQSIKMVKLNPVEFKNEI